MSNKLTRRKILVVSGAVVTWLGTSAFGLKSITGGGGGGSWKAIVTDWRDGLSTLAKQAVALGLAQADLAEALGLKQEAALMRGQAKMLEEKGDTLGGSDLEEFGKNSETTQVAINEKIATAATLSVEQKVAMAEAGKKIAPAMVKTVKATFKLSKAAAAASKAGSPGISDVSAAPVAAEIPVLMPKAIDIIPKMVGVSQDFQKIAAEKDVAVPEMPTTPDFG